MKSFKAPTEQTPIALVLGSDGALYGVTNRGGESDLGTIFRLDAAQRFSSLHSFSGPDGSHPTLPLVVGSDDALYGITPYGGSFGLGTIFKIDSAGIFTSLHSFSGADGAHPRVPLVLGSDGALYGATDVLTGGTATIFKIDTAGSFTSYPLHEIGCNAGTRSPLVLGSDGALYGIQTYCRTIFRIDSAGTYTTLRSDTPYIDAPLTLGADGALYGTHFLGQSAFRIDSEGNYTLLHSFHYGFLSLAPLILGNDGALYGTVHFPGGSGFGRGWVYRIDSAGAVTWLYEYPSGVGATLVVGSDGALYGASYGRLPYRTSGTIFRIDGSGNVTTLHTFSGGDGSGPSAPLVVGNDGALYGISQGLPGSSFSGTLFRIDNAGSLTSLHSFGTTDGAFPTKSLVGGEDGTLYGIAGGGGSWGTGAIFKIDRAGTLTTLHALDDPNLRPALIRGGDKTVYGTTGSMVFRIDGTGTFSSLHSFERDLCDYYDSSASTSLVVGTDGALYGIHTHGFDYDYFGCRRSGTFFRIDPAGTFSSLLEDRNLPSSPLVLGSDGALYGTSPYGGSAGYGAVSRIDLAGTLIILHSFSGDDGEGPFNPLVLGNDGALYGVTPSVWQSCGESCERFRSGSIFKVDSAGTFTSLHSFDDGASPSAALVLGSDGALYGTTEVSCGALTCGGVESVFRIDGTGSLTSLHSFSYTDGSGPFGPLVMGSDYGLYGTTQYGGFSGAGTIFRIDPLGSFTSLHSFDYFTDGSEPSSTLVVGSDCALFGTTPNGGPGQGGVLYRVYEPGHLCQRIHFDPLPDRTLGDPPFTVGATSSSGLPVFFAATGSCSVIGETVTLTGAGLCTLTASQVGNADYGPAPEVSQAFHVYFDFKGFLSPVNAPPSVNRAHAGRTVPVEFRLAGDAGPDVLEAALVRRVGCDTLAPEGDFKPAASAGASALSSAKSNGRYTFRWKTQNSWAGSCRELALELVDGSVHRAYFSFKRKHPNAQSDEQRRDDEDRDRDRDRDRDDDD